MFILTPGFTPNQEKKMNNMKCGTLAELRFCVAAIENGWQVYSPVADGGSCDYLCLIPDEHTPIVARVQVKSSTYQRADNICEMSCKKQRDGVVVPYSSDDVDFVAVTAWGEWWIIPVLEVAHLTKFYLYKDEPVGGRKRLNDFSAYRNQWVVNMTGGGSESD
jgi:hypothetical protein